jgi:tRNA 2-thiouridine synthesizing protein A
MTANAESVTVTTVDARGQSCPAPLVTLYRALKDAPPGSRFELLATDPGSKSDVPSWSTLTGHTLEDSSEREGVFHYVIRKA